MSPVLCDAGPLITLAKLNRLELLAELYHDVQTTQAVYEEVVTQGLARGATDAYTVQLFWRRQSWPIVTVPESILSDYTPSVILDPGETEVLALAQTIKNPLVLLDDEIARSEARRLRLNIRGTLGILTQAYRRSLLSLTQVELLIEGILVRPDIWISHKLCEEVMQALRNTNL
jgi:predicted nucleic acid-binding protein